MTAQTRPSPDPARFPTAGSPYEQARFLLQYAVLAPSSHNAQPWAFAVDGRTIDVFADGARRLDVADETGRELDVSVGCALENLLVAATHFGFDATVEDDEDASTAQRDSDDDRYRHLATVVLDPAPTEGTSARAGDEALFEAITERSTNHGRFDDRDVPGSLLDAFEDVAAQRDVDCHVVVDAATKHELATLQARADRELFDDPAYRRELAHWIGTGALGANWVTARISAAAVRHLDLGDREGEKNSRLLANAPAVVVLATTEDDATGRLRVGRTFERLALAATARDVAVHPMSQLLEVPAVRRETASVLDASEQTLQHCFRVGYAEPDATVTPRRPLEDVLR